MIGDTLTVEGDEAPGMPLIKCVMHNGRRTAPSPTLAEIREYAHRQLALLPPASQALEPAPPYPVEVSATLRALADQVDRDRT